MVLWPGKTFISGKAAPPSVQSALLDGALPRPIQILAGTLHDDDDDDNDDDDDDAVTRSRN